MLIHGWDESLDQHGWRTFLAEHPFGHLVASGPNRDLAVVVPTQFVLDGDEVVIHLARPNPIWAAIEENDQVTVWVAADWAFIPSSWKAVGDEDPRLGIPTTYYASARLVGTARIIDDVDDVADVLRQQLGVLQPTEDVVDPSDHGVRLRAIRGLRIAVSEVRAKFKFGGNVDEEHRVAVAARLRDRDGPGGRECCPEPETRSRSWWWAMAPRGGSGIRAVRPSTALGPPDRGSSGGSRRVGNHDQRGTPSGRR